MKVHDLHGQGTRQADWKKPYSSIKLGKARYLLKEAPNGERQSAHAQQKGRGVLASAHTWRRY